MAKRRANREGSIFRRKDGRWCAKIYVDGTIVYKYSPNQRECTDWLLEIRQKLNAGLQVINRSTLADYLQHWLETARPTVRPKTAIQYRQIVNQHIIPYLGDITLDRLRPDHLQALYSKKLDSGASARTVQLIHAVIHRALKQALNWGLVGRNVADTVRKPKVIKRELHTLTAAQAQQLFITAQGDRLEALYHLAVVTGLRQGELLALRWDDLDWETSQLSIQRQVQRITGQGLVFAQLKTAASGRVVALGPATVDQLRRHLSKVREMAVLAGDAWHDSDLIFPSIVGTPIEPRNLYRHFQVLLKRAGLPKIRFHDLRHTSATLMLQQGVHPKIVQERLGHSSISLTLDTYSHVLPHLQSEAAQLIEDLVTPIAAQLPSPNLTADT